MRLEKASFKAIKYACRKFHYTESVPSVSCAYSVFNDNYEWCGVICFSAGANNNICKPYGLVQGQVVELVRVALNGKQEATSKAVAIALRLAKKHNPLVKLFISYADPQQGHLGVIYQAMNWIYVGKSKAQREVICPDTGKIMHKRTANSKFGTIVGLKKSEIFWKHKYVFPVDNETKKHIELMRVKYPKHAAVAHMGERRATSTEGAFDTTLPLKNSVKTS